ncbi:MAG: hypothetical protein MUF48_10130 [Pirellulaceae bacterium]|nr:hypothetical protein [Pirellulaceae bacterium]
MAHVRFSLTFALIFTSLIAVTLSFAIGILSAALRGIWVVSFLIGYRISSHRGWRRIGEVSLLAGCVWVVAIFSAYACYVGRIGAPDVVQLMSHACVIAAAGVLAALAAACLVEACLAGIRHGMRQSWSHRVVLASAVAAFTLLASAVWMSIRPHYWDPVQVITDGRWHTALLAVPVGGKPSTDHDYVQVVGAPNRSMHAAILNGQQNVWLLDSHTEQRIAHFSVNQDNWFSDISFSPNNLTLSALCNSRHESPKLLRWDAPHWIAREVVFLSDLLDDDCRAEEVSLSLDKDLLICGIRRTDQRQTTIHVLTANVLAHPVVLQTFSSAVIDRQASDDPRRSTTTGRCEWSVSESREWIAASSERPAQRRDYAIGRNGIIRRLSGRVIGFFSGTDYLVVHEWRSTVVWKGRQHVTFAPPFWDYLGLAGRSRMVVFDCHNQTVVARTRWYPNLAWGRMTPDARELLANAYDRHAHDTPLLVWQCPPDSTD